MSRKNSGKGAVKHAADSRLSFLGRTGAKLTVNEDLVSKCGISGIVGRRVRLAESKYNYREKVVSLDAKFRNIYFVIYLVIRKIGVLSKCGKAAVKIYRVGCICRDFENRLFTGEIEAVGKIAEYVLLEFAFLPNPL